MRDDVEIHFQNTLVVGEDSGVDICLLIRLIFL